MDVVEIARKKAAELEREAKELRQFIATYEALSGEKSGENAASIADTQPDHADNSGPQVADSPPRKRGDKPSRIVSAAISAVTERGEPMTRSQLVKALENEGLVIGGTDKNKNMGTILWRSKKFENVEGKGYWPIELGEWALYNL